MTMRYLDETVAEYTVEVNQVPRYGFLQLAPGQSPSGYGNRISTDYMIVVGKRRYRVYCVCYSNSGSLYIVKGGEKLWAREHILEEKLENQKTKKI